MRLTEMDFNSFSACRSECQSEAGHNTEWAYWLGYVCMYVCVCVFVSVHVCMQVCVCTYVFMNVTVHVYIVAMDMMFLHMYACNAVM